MGVRETIFSMPFLPEPVCDTLISGADAGGGGGGGHINWTFVPTGGRPRGHAYRGQSYWNGICRSIKRVPCKTWLRSCQPWKQLATDLTARDGQTEQLPYITTVRATQQNSVLPKLDHIQVHSQGRIKSDSPFSLTNLSTWILRKKDWPGGQGGGVKSMHLVQNRVRWTLLWTTGLHKWWGISWLA
jgi:hypothetical protein